jgi:uncharacterized protein YlxW (UPF0749 family)
MDISERELFQSVHGISGNQLVSVKSEVETRKMSHKDFRKKLQLESDTDSVEKRFDKLKTQRTNANDILKKYKKYMTY